MKPCTIEGCARPLLAKGLCRVHYERRKRHGDPSVTLKPMSPHGAPMAWLRAHATHEGEGCLTWPFSRHANGYAHMRVGRPPRIMCELAHGPAPSDAHQAAHSCGRGHEACVHPKHLRWATPAENAADKLGHGTHVEGARHYGAKLTEADVRSIRAQRGKRLQRELAEAFGVRITCINKILNGRAWRHVQ